MIAGRAFGSSVTVTGWSATDFRNSRIAVAPGSSIIAIDPVWIAGQPRGSDSAGGSQVMSNLYVATPA